MPCYKPLPAYQAENGSVVFSELQRHRIVRTLDLPCGQCIGCRLDRSRSWGLRIMHEASLQEDNCFVTLTYDDANLPSDGSLRYSDFQAFMRRLRKHFKPRPIRFYMCGEYGETTTRPHFHACLFNINFVRDQKYFKKSNANTFNPIPSYIYTSPTLSKLWPLGQVTVGNLTLQSAQYTARYIMSKVTGDLAETHYEGREPEFNQMSLRPGIGARWLERFRGDVELDYVVDRDGNKQKLPAYYDKLLKRAGDDVSQRKADRELKALPHRADNTTARLSVKETVKTAQVRSLRRTM